MFELVEFLFNLCAAMLFAGLACSIALTILLILVFAVNVVRQEILVGNHCCHGQQKDDHK